MATQAPRKEISRKDLGDNYLEVTFEGGETEKMLVFAADHEAKRFASYRPPKGRDSASGIPAANVEKGQVNPVGGMSRATRDIHAMSALEGAPVLRKFAKGSAHVTEDGAVLMPTTQDVMKANEIVNKHSLAELVPVIPDDVLDVLEEVCVRLEYDIDQATKLGDMVSLVLRERLNPSKQA